MPLPLIPLVLGGAALVTGGFGAKKGYDAKSDYSKAKSTNREAQDIVEDAQKYLEQAREEAQTRMVDLGKTKKDLYQNALIPFVETFSKIKNVNFNDENLMDGSELPPVTQEELQQLEDSVLEIKNVFTGGTASLGAGGLAGLATYGGVGLLGKASSGAAITTLSGAAAKNATLAWLGGGAIKAGGLGMAGGTAVLGGLVAGPVLAVGGMMLASKAKEAVENASSNLSKARLAAEEMKSARVATTGISSRFKQVNDVITKLAKHLATQTQYLEALISLNPDFETYTTEAQERVYMAAATAKTLKVIMETPIIDQDGVLTNDSRQAITQGKKALAEL